MRANEPNLKHKSRAISAAAAIIVVILILVIAAAAWVYYPPGSLVGNKTSQTTAVVGCNQAPIESKVLTYNSLPIAAGTVEVDQLSGGQYIKVVDASGSLTLNTWNSASGPYATPWVATFGGTGYYQTTLPITSIPSTFTDPISGLQDGNVLCTVTTGQYNNVPVFTEWGQVFRAPQGGILNTTHVESVINSQTSQTNSFPAAFPTTAPQTENAYLQVFSNSVSAGRPVSIVSTASTPVTDYGGINGEPAQSSIVKGALVYYQMYAVVAFNQTSISLTGPAGTVKLPSPATSVEAYMIPVTCAGPSPNSGTSTSNPYIACSLSFTVQENVAATGHHVEFFVAWSDNTQGGYIQQFFGTTTGVQTTGSWCTPGNSYTAPSGVSGLYPPTASNAPAPLIRQYSCVLATY